MSRITEDFSNVELLDKEYGKRLAALEARLDKLETGLALLVTYGGMDEDEDIDNLLGRTAVQTTNDYLFADPAADFKDGKDSKGNKRKAGKR